VYIEVEREAKERERNLFLNKFNMCVDYYVKKAEQKKLLNYM